jgi:hypothetical protein
VEEIGPIGLFPHPSPQRPSRELSSGAPEIGEP